ncbi:MAG TPA: (d)CMP kinase [Bauldia sp.]|nr:(d)CMP kinase [Bauldia sp.]
MIIAIDGPAAAGKGTLAQRLANYYKLPYLDTGLLYRLVGRLVIERGDDPDDAAAASIVALNIDPAALADPNLRGREAGEIASRVSVHAGVRAALLKFQRDFANQTGGAVLDGRDIGTVIAPNADVKIYVTASPEVRARRRTDELLNKGRNVRYRTILSEIKERDERDAGRRTAPLAQAPDAFLLDTSHMNPEQAFQAAIAIVEKAKADR